MFVDMGLDRPCRRIGIKKMGARSGRDYWCDEYDSEFKYASAPANKPQKEPPPTNVAASKSKRPQNEPPDVFHGAGYDADLPDVS